MSRTYYVQSGSVKEILIAPTAKDAVKAAIMRGCEKELIPGLLISCNTIGFGEHPDQDLMFVTENELKTLHYDAKQFLKGFKLTEAQWIAYKKIKTAIEAFQDLIKDDGYGSL